MRGRGGPGCEGWAHRLRDEPLQPSLLAAAAGGVGATLLASTDGAARLLSAKGMCKSPSGASLPRELEEGPAADRPCGARPGKCHNV